MRSFFTLLLALLASGGPVFAQLTSTNLPIVIINTNVTVGNTQLDGTIKIINNMSGVNQPADAPAHNEVIGIRLRGNGSDPKKSYNIETWVNVLGASKNVSLLGMPEENDWVLMAAYPDRSLLRDVTGNYIWQQMGYYATRLRPVEVIMNQGTGDEYLGVYLFGEKIKRDSARVDIATLQLTDNGGDEVTGGYIITIDETNDGGWVSDHLPPYASGNQHVMFHYNEPKDADITGPQISYIQNWMKRFEDTLASNNYQDTTIGWRAYAANKWFRDYLIFSEVIKDNNAYRKNVFMYKDKLKKLRLGPLWAMEKALYNTGDCNASDATGFAYMYGQNCNTSTYLPTFWWERLMTDTMFVRELKCRYTQMRDNVLDTATIYHYIDSMSAYLNVSQGGNTAQGRNFAKWPIFGVNLINEPGGGPTDYANEISRIKTFIQDRLTWLDAQWYTPGCALGIAQLLGDEENSYLSPNPTTGSFTTYVILKKQTKVGVTVRDIRGAVVYHKEYTLASGEHQMNHSLENLPAALYIVTIQQDDRSRNFKLVKN